MQNLLQDRRSLFQAMGEQYALQGYLQGWGAEALHKLFGRREQKSTIEDPAAMLGQIEHIGGSLRSLSIDRLHAVSMELAERARAGKPLSELVAPAFALVRECSQRVLGMRHYDVQLFAGMVVCEGQVAEMATGEGKTLVQSLAAYTRALSGKGVHVATANSYLAARDEEFARPLYEVLGMRSALLPERESPAVKKAAYDADITYGTGTEFGFDYLRDNLQMLRMPPPALGERFLAHFQESGINRGKGLAQRGLAFALIDEIDSILIDEASTPLVISRRSENEHPAPEPFYVARDMVAELQHEVHYTVAHGRPVLTEEGLSLIDSFQDRIPWSQLRRPWKKYVDNALHAHQGLHRDTDYLIENNSGDEPAKIVIIDQFTGRGRPDSSWRDGLHQAVEACEGLLIGAESVSDASVSRQRFYRLYDAVGGMTGTAGSAAGEFWQAFRLPVRNVAPRKPSCAQHFPPRVFQTREQKTAAVVEAIEEIRTAGRPVLVGTRTIENSEALSRHLAGRNVPHQLLNARQDAGEAEIVASAGVAGTVTIATNMAGRGTHISVDPQVLERGGLHVIAFEMEESRRIDRQLTGRTARQGQRGSAQLFLSAEDHLLTTFAPQAIDDLTTMKTSSTVDGEVVDAKRAVKWFQAAQAVAEKNAYQARRKLLHRDGWLSDTRERL